MARLRPVAFGPTPAEAGIAFCDVLLSDATNVANKALALHVRALLLAMRGDFARAVASAADARELIEEFGLTLGGGIYSMDVGFALLLAGDLEQAEHELRRGHDLLAGVGDTGARCTVDAMLADVLQRQGDLDEAARFAEESRAIAAPDDLDAQPRWRAALARVLAAQGLYDAALEHALDAVALVEPVDLLPLKAVVYDSLGEVHAAAGRIDEAVAAVEQAIGASRAEGQHRLGRALPLRAGRASRGATLVDSTPWRRARTAGVENPAEARFCMSCAAPLGVGARTRAAQGRHRSLLRPRRLDGARRVDRSGGAPGTDAALLRGSARRSSSATAAPSRSSSATRSWPSSGSRSRTRTTRCVRSAPPSEMRPAIAEHGLEARIGINTGEVVVGGEGETLVTGDAVNVAARLEQAAAAGEILIGAETRLLVRDAVRVEAVEPLALKGKSEPVEAFRLLEVIGDAAPLARHPETPLVGRERERQRLWRDYEDAVADRTCRLFTLLGPAGIGKSRLVADFLERVGDAADVLRGRCLSYGEGITYWPLVEILIAIGVEPDSVIGTSPPETQLAFRRLLEARAAERPQVVVIDDLQWAEPVFVDLVEHVADFSRDAPIFLLCVARTELLDVRPGWGGGKLNATSLLLEPLGAERVRGAHGAPRRGRSARRRAARADHRAPRPATRSYVEEMLAMVREHGGDGEIAVPPTIHALLQARIDSLDGDVRVVMERGSVEGEVFHRGAVAELSPDLCAVASNRISRRSSARS